MGDTVDASYTNSMGEPYLNAFWTDPDFDPKQRAFYCVRVMEIPTPRWTTFDRKIFGVESPEGAPAGIHERAYTSLICYTSQRAGWRGFCPRKPLQEAFLRKSRGVCPSQRLNARRKLAASW